MYPRLFAVRLADELVLEMRNNDSIKVTARSALAIASELRRLSPMEAESTKLIEVNKVLVDKLRLALKYMEKYEDEFSHPTCNEMREALKLAGELA